MKKIKEFRGITLIALIITIIILLILAGVTIASLGGENGLIAKVNQAKKAQIKAEMKEQLILAINGLQLEKEGKATLDDVTQEWINGIITDYDCTITSDASISGKKVTMQKSGVTGKYIIDQNLNITETADNNSSVEFSYEVGTREGDIVKILIRVQDKENGLTRIEFPDKDAIIVQANKKEEKGIDYEVEIGIEYKIKIISENGQTTEETILIEDYWHTITKNLGEGISIDNTATKAAYNKPYEATLTSGENYIINNITVKMAGTDVTSTVYDSTTGKISIEKVTGDIEITAAAKKLEIITTEVYVNTYQNATSSVEDNSQDKGTTLYINFSATLEGQQCTIKYKEDETKTVPYSITDNGKYVFVVTGSYNGKTITKEVEVNVDKYKIIGGYVKYDAGEWTQDEIEGLQDLNLYDLNANHTSPSGYKVIDSNQTGLTFGGFTYAKDNQGNVNTDSTIEGVITSRNKSIFNLPVTSTLTEQDKINFEGWQLFETEAKNGKIYVKKLISAGVPEAFTYYCYYHVANPTPTCYIANYIMSNGEYYKDYDNIGGTKVNPRRYDMYKDKNQLNIIKNVRSFSDEDYTQLQTMFPYEQHCNLTGPSTFYLCYSEVPYIYGNWDMPILSIQYGRYTEWAFGTSSVSHCASYRVFGVRIVIDLNDNVYIASGRGTASDPYVLAMETTE